MADDLTARQAEVLSIIRAHQLEHGYPPTVREIGNAMHIGSTNAVTDHLRALERKGAITRTPYAARSIKLVEPLTTRDRLARVAPLLPEVLAVLAAAVEAHIEHLTPEEAHASLLARAWAEGKDPPPGIAGCKRDVKRAARGSDCAFISV